MTVTGLSTINLSTLSGFQQAIVFCNMFIGSPIFVSLIMISVRKYFFQKEFDHIIEARRKALRESEAGGLNPLRKLRTMSQNFGSQGRPNLNKSSWIDRFSLKKNQDGKKQDSKKRSDSPVKEGEVDPSDDSSHSEMNRNDTWKKELAQGGIFTANPTFATSERARTPAPETLAEKPPMPRPGMERQPTNWNWHWGKQDGKGGPKPRVHAGMIKRVEGGGQGLINPMGWYQSSSAPGSTSALDSFAPTPSGLGPGILDNPITIATSPEPVAETEGLQFTESPKSMNARLPDFERPRTASPEPDLLRRGSEPPVHAHPLPPAPMEDKFPRTKTIAFDGIDDPPRTAYASGRDTAGMYTHTPGHGYLPRTGTIRSSGNPGIIGTSGSGGLERTMTERRSVAGSRNMPLASTMNTGYMPRTMTVNQTAKHENFGGFPTPLALGKALFVKAFPETGNKLKRNLTIHRTVTQAGTMTQATDGISEVRPVDYISFDASEFDRGSLTKGNR